MSLHLKRHSYKTVTGPAMFHGAECVRTNKNQMRCMPQRKYGAKNRYDNKENIRENQIVLPIEEKDIKCCLKQLGHVQD